MLHLSVIQHTQSEWLGHIEDHLEGRGIRFSYFRPFTSGGSLPELATLGAGLILVGGGAWGTAGPEHLLPTLDREVRLVRACLMTGKPVLALGLGSQILSLAADGGVEQRPLRLEVGLASRIAADALGGLLPERLPNVVFMRDQPRPPAYAVTLALDPAGGAAIFSIGERAIGFTGHPGIRRAMIEDLVMELDETPEDVAAGLDAMSGSARQIEDMLVPVMAGLVAALGWTEIER
jgi:GMP synthase-like glutamine amidotransferase